jgi:hypothetical protein
MLTTPVERRLGFFFLEMASWVGVPRGLSPSTKIREKISRLNIGIPEYRLGFFLEIAN